MDHIAPDLIARCAALALQNGPDSRPGPTGVEGLSVVRAQSPQAMLPTIYQPMICLVLQGAKEIRHRSSAVGFAAGETAIVSHELVTSARITTASGALPYVALAATIDPEILRSIQAELPPEALQAARSEAVASGAAGRGVVDVMTRLLDLAGRPHEARILLPLIRRELHLRALMSPHGGMLRELSVPGSPASRIARAVAHIRANWNTPLRTQDLAELAGMSPSSFHEHFRAVTATSPIQYQKALRLHAAYQQLPGDHSVSAVAFAVGYESPTQFARDYRRAYGATPRDRMAAKISG
ncbi:AraC family transcriptional regulator [Paracoccus shanxieyensis]|uniref:Helix-turn-helix domain-containing protein n=1 Tax=Paracoccus shanxieyensis TaxID=2675752 RepID=A0A6L6J061_9RHOB|nr:AraC family transcriptional regulator [Paracoccus shanxieyensis]MTH64224.1 helix-turn-helix domain-containing protein [Paracoccus shanxieyensis]MTH87368.1 helix-turn-helix domain-containing protein [Paracoccus shanxieyensis]